MGLYAYCVVPATHEPPDSLRGLEERPVTGVAMGGLLVWVSLMARPQATVDGAQAHNRVVEAAVTEEVTPVPLRFGQWLADEPALAAAMAGREVEYRAMLARFAGCLEFGLRLLDVEQPRKARDVQAEAVTSGFEYMQALRESSRLAEQQRQHAEQVRVRVHEILRDVAREERIQEESTASALLTVAHLVARPRFDEYRERARRLRTVFPTMRLLLSGPWAPYSFAA